MSKEKEKGKKRRKNADSSGSSIAALLLKIDREGYGVE